MSKSDYYKSVKISLAAWKALTRICAETESPRTKTLSQLVLEAEQRMKVQKEATPE